MAYGIYGDDRLSSPASYGGLLEIGQRTKLLRGDSNNYSYRGFSRETSRLLCGRTFATRLKRADKQERDIFNLFNPENERYGDCLPAPEELDD